MLKGTVLKLNAASIFVMLFAWSNLVYAQTDDRSYLTAAQAAAEALITSAIDTEHGKCWPEKTTEQDQRSNSLYRGGAGVVLFFLEAYYSTGNAEYLNLARTGADHLLATLDEEIDMGLYLGVAGIGYALEEVHKASGLKKYRSGAVNCLDIIKSKAIDIKKGITWEHCTDLFYGNAGIGLFLLYIAKEINDQAAADLAAAAGQYLLDVALPVGNGLRWWVVQENDRCYSNFAHGVSGIAYFLARLYEDSGQTKFLNGAIGGARYLTSIAKVEGNACYFFVRTPELEDVYRLSWCNGTTGTARLFLQLFRVTGEKSWMVWAKRCGNSLLNSGFPENSEGIWWLHQCCGPSGAAQFLLSLFWYTDDTAYLDYCGYLSSYVCSNAIDQEGNFRQDYIGDTGFMTGTAGIGALFLRMDAFDQKKNWNIIFPDSPWLLVNRYDYSLEKIKTSKKIYSADEKISISAKVKNIGHKKTPATNITFYFSQKVDTVLGLPKQVTKLGSMKLKRVAVGKKSKIKFSKPIPKGSKGAYYVVAVVDPDGQNPDMFRINNHLASKSKIRIK